MFWLQNNFLSFVELYKSSAVDLNDATTYHRLIEAEKFVFAQRSKLGDVGFMKHTQIVSRNMTK